MTNTAIERKPASIPMPVDLKRPLRHRTSTTYAGALAGEAARGQAAALRQLWSLAWREAQVQTYADAFLTIMLCFVIAAAMMPPMRKVAPHGTGNGLAAIFAATGKRLRKLPIDTAALKQPV